MFQKIAPYIKTYLSNRSSFTIDELIELVRPQGS